MKYYRMTAFTPYCGEELTDVAMAESEEALRLSGKADALIEDCAAEWFDSEEYETYGFDSPEDYEESYYSECGCTIEEITEEEYKAERGKW